MLLEHYAGAFPTWLAPVQVRVLPVRDDHMAYADRLVDRLRAEGFRADMVDAGEPLGNRIRKAKVEKLPYVLVVGDDDVEAGTVGVNPRGGEVERGVPSTTSSSASAAEVAPATAVSGRDRREPTVPATAARSAPTGSTTCGPAGGRLHHRLTPTTPALRPDDAGRLLFERILAASPTTRPSSCTGPSGWRWC